MLKELVFLAACVQAISGHGLVTTDGCGRSRVCLTVPDGCAITITPQNLKNATHSRHNVEHKPGEGQECHTVVAFQVSPWDPAYVTVELMTKLEPCMVGGRKCDEDSDTVLQYAAVGFLNGMSDADMKDMSVTECVYNIAHGEDPHPDDGKIYFSHGHPPKRMSPQPNGMALRRNLLDPNNHCSSCNGAHAPIFADDGLLMCRFDQKIKPGIDGLPDLDQYYYIAVATGYANATASMEHEVKNKTSPYYPHVSKYMLKPTDPINRYQRKVQLLIKIHGSLMLIVFWIMFMGSIITARYFRNLKPDESWMGQKIWFQIHRSVNVVGLVLFLAALVCTVWAHKGWDGPPKKDKTFSEWDAGDWHALTGAIATPLMLGQPIGAALRCHPGNANRFVFNWIHRGTGFMLIIISGAQCLLASQSDHDLFNRARFGSWPLYLALAYIVSAVVAFVAMELHMVYTDKNDRRRVLSFEPKKIGSDEMGVAKIGGFRRVMFALFMIIGVATVITLIIFITTSNFNPEVHDE